MLTRSVLFVISRPYDAGAGVFCGVGVRTGVGVDAGVLVVVGFCIGFFVAGVGESAAEVGAVVLTVFDAGAGVIVCIADPDGAEGEAAAVCAAGAEDAASGAGSSLPQAANKKRNSMTIHKSAKQILLRCFFILRFLSLLL